jgi:hypothetical protein
MASAPFFVLSGTCALLQNKASPGRAAVVTDRQSGFGVQAWAARRCGAAAAALSENRKLEILEV